MRYLKMKNRIFLIPELIFFVSGLYCANNLSKYDLKNAPVTLETTIKIIVIICLISISFSISEILKGFINWIQKSKQEQN